MRRPLGALAGPAFGLVLAALGATLVYSSCGGGDEFNLYRPLTKSAALKSSSAAQLEEARVDLDKRQYAAALNLLTPVVDDPARDSDEARILYVSAKLGSSGLEIWGILSTLLTAADGAGGARSSGLNQVLNQINASVLGTGVVRQERIRALSDSIDALQHAPDPAAAGVQNTACIVAAFLAAPTFSDGLTAVTGITAALDQIQKSALSGGAVCPDIGKLDAATATLPAVINSMNYILSAAKGCAFLDLSQTAAQVNKVTAMLKTLTANVDKGCDALPACPAAVPNCKAFFPPCIQQALAVGTSDARAGDGIIAPCELILHCAADPKSCFPAAGP